VTLPKNPMPRPWRVCENGVLLTVRVTPRGGRDSIDGVTLLDDGRSLLRVRVRPAAEDGAANLAVIALLAKELGLARRDLEITSGLTARVKQVRLSGYPEMLIDRLSAMAAKAGEG